MTSAWGGWVAPDQLALRSGVPLGLLVVLASALQAGASPGPWSVVLLLGLAVLAACRPDSTAGLALLLAVLLVWTDTPDSGSPWVLLAAAGLLFAHCCLLVAAQGPARLRVDRVQVRVWAARGALVWLAAVTVWVLARVLPEPPADRWVVAAGLLAVACGVLATGRHIHPN